MATVGVAVTASTPSASTLSTAASATGVSGSCFYIFIGRDTASTVSTVTDSVGNTYTLLSSAARVSSAATFDLYRSQDNPTGSATHTATVTTAAVAAYSIAFIEVIGSTGSASQEAAAALALDSASPFTTSITTVNANALVLAFASSTVTTFAAPMSTAVSYIDVPGTSWSISVGQATEASPGAKTYTVNAPASTEMVLGAVSIKPLSTGTAFPLMGQASL